jgi:hypothetical protein
MFGSADRRWGGENIITRYQMTVRVEALYSRNPFVRGQSQTLYCGVRELSDGFIVAAFLIVDCGNCVTDDQALADSVMRPQTLQQRIPPVLCL